MLLLLVSSRVMVDADALGRKGVQLQAVLQQIRRAL